jgi:small GTP-binding protein
MSRISNIDVDDDDEDFLNYKLILLGDSSVGKTSLINRFCNSKFEESCSATIGVDTKTKYIKYNDKKIELEIWDTAGEERYKSLARNCYQGADGIILVYDITQKETFYNIKNWYNDINESINIKKVAIIIVGNKLDLPDKEVNNEIREKFCEQYNLKLFEISCKKNIKINDVFCSLIDKMIELDSDYKQQLKKRRSKVDESTFVQRKKNKKCCQ